MSKGRGESTLDKVKNFQKILEEKRATLHRLQGEEKAMMKQLKEQFGIDDVTKVATRLQEIKKEMSRLSRKLESMVERIQHDYNLEVIDG